ncbi:MAG: PilZ domain-containing protein [Candidatus Brocadiales bacterium]|nr:PilZ domain-containing protein [Candidatus Brocadiales bacterium]
MYEISEKRKYRRIEKLFIARFRTKPDKAPDMAATDWDMVSVNDLGAGGIFCYFRRNFEIGTTLELKISFSTSIPPTECRGVVTRVKKHPAFSVFGTATVFTEIDKHVKEMINRTALFMNPDNQFLLKKA